MELEPIFRIAGTKTGQSLIDACVLLRGYMKQGFRLVEPFCGSASVSIACQPERLLLTDLQPNIVLTLQVLRSKPFSLLNAFDHQRARFLAEPTHEAFYRIRNNPPKTAVERAAWFIFITHAAFNWLWRVNSQGRCNTTFGAEAGIRRVKSALSRENTLALATWLNSEEKAIELADAFTTIGRTGEGDVLYIDPPYVGQFDSYNNKKFGKEGHKRLCVALWEATCRGAQVIMQCNAEPSIASLYTGFCKVLLRNVRRVVAGTKIAGKHCNDWEMIIISQPLQLNFLLEQPEDSPWFGGTIKPVWNEHKKHWETWTPPPQVNLSLF